MGPGTAAPFATAFLWTTTISVIKVKHATPASAPVFLVTHTSYKQEELSRLDDNRPACVLERFTAVRRQFQDAWTFRLTAKTENSCGTILPITSTCCSPTVTWLNYNEEERNKKYASTDDLIISTHSLKQNINQNKIEKQLIYKDSIITVYSQTKQTNSLFLNVTVYSQGFKISNNSISRLIDMVVH